MSEVLLAFTDKGVAHVLDAHSGTSLHTVKDCQPCINGSCTTNDFLICAERERSFIHMWTWRKDQPRFRCQTPERITCLTCTADGAHCIGGGLSGKLYLWQLATGRLLINWSAHYKPVTVLACALSDGFVLSAGEDAVILAWNLAELLHTGFVREPMLDRPYRSWSEHTLSVNALCVAPLGQHDLIVSASTDQTVRVWRLADALNSSVCSAEFSEALTAAAIHPQHTTVYAGSVTGSIYPIPLLLETDTPRIARVQSMRSGASHSGQVRSICVSGDGLRLFSCGTDPGLRAWDAQTMALLQVFQPSMIINSLVLICERPDALGVGRGGSVSANTGAASLGAFNTGGTTAVLLAPLKKFCEVLPDDGEASLRAMGCVSCLPGGDDNVSDGVLGADELPLFATALDPHGPGDHGERYMETCDEGSLDTEAALATAEATIRQLRSQLAQVHQVNTELYQTAVDATLGFA